MKSYGEIIFGGIIVLMLSLFIYFSLGYKPSARIVPLIVAIPAFFLSVYQLYLSFSQEKSKRGEDRKKRRQDGPARRKIILQVWIWLIALVAAAYFLGLLPASLLFMFCFLRFFSHKSWLTSAIASMAFFTVIYLLFHTLLEKL